MMLKKTLIYIKKQSFDQAKQVLLLGNGVQMTERYVN